MIGPVDLDDFLAALTPGSAPTTADRQPTAPDRGSSDPIRPLNPRDPAPIRPTGPRHHGTVRHLRAVA